MVTKEKSVEKCPECDRNLVKTMAEFWKNPSYSCPSELSRRECNDTTWIDLLCATGKIAKLEDQLAAAVARAERADAALADVAYLDQLGRVLGTRALDTMPSELPGIDEDHVHFVLMPIGPVSRRAAVNWASQLGLLPDQPHDGGEGNEG